LGITILANPGVLWPKTINNSCTPLESILSKHPKYKTFKQQLRHNHILYLEQLTITSCLNGNISRPDSSTSLEGKNHSGSHT
jgi:hypothetical protein